MKKISFFIIIIGLSQNIVAQNDILYLFIEKPFFQYQTLEDITIGFTIDSKDERFVCDYYKFGVFNSSWSKEEKDVINLSLPELRKEIRIDSIHYETISSLSKDKKWWELHNDLSLRNKIFLLEKKRGKLNTKSNVYDCKYYIIPLIYEGTRKNIIPTDLSSKRYE